MPVYLDIETTGLEDDAVITCAVTLSVSAGGAGKAPHVKERRWHGAAGEPMPPVVVRAMAEYLVKMSAREPVVTFNGVGFDMKRLYAAITLTGPEDAELAEAFRQMSKGHLDLMYDLWCDVGYMSSLDSFAAAEGLGGKTNSGGWAATAWAPDEKACQQVLDYCAADVELLRKVHEAAVARGRLRRRTKAGRERTWVLPGADTAPHTVRTAEAAHRAYKRSPPDTSWMTEPPTHTPADAFAWLAN